MKKKFFLLGTINLVTIEKFSGFSSLKYFVLSRWSLIFHFEVVQLLFISAISQTLIVVQHSLQFDEHLQVKEFIEFI
jgi:hypothetical protein